LGFGAVRGVAADCHHIVAAEELQGGRAPSEEGQCHYANGAHMLWDKECRWRKADTSHVVGAHAPARTGGGDSGEEGRWGPLTERRTLHHGHAGAVARASGGQGGEGLSLRRRGWWWIGC
jgi:hypothetical protein